MDGGAQVVWLGKLRDAQGNLLGRTPSWILKNEKIWSREQGGGHSRRGCSRDRGLERDLGKALKDKEGLNRLRRERKAHQRGAQHPMGNYTR